MEPPLAVSTAASPLSTLLSSGVHELSVSAIEATGAVTTVTVAEETVVQPFAAVTVTV